MRLPVLTVKAGGVDVSTSRTCGRRPSATTTVATAGVPIPQALTWSL
jgi:hypothetical protein